MKPGKPSNQALLRTLANKDALNFATRRLLIDLKELENHKIPTVGVTARPMDDDLFTWHANLRGPEGTPYEGGVFHLELKIPETYPHNPPTVELLVDLPHPNVTGRKLCLDMLQNSRVPGQGWSSAYSIMSVLIQLQSFLFEKFYDDVKRGSMIKKAIETANQFKCNRKFCKHGGKLAAWPPFDSRESTQAAFKILETETELFKKELVCFHTKLDHDTNALGIGLEVTRIARTGLIKQASPCLDYISLKAFIKEGIRQSSTNEHFTFWLPLFFGNHKERTLHVGKKAVSMICTGHTKRFKEAMVLDLFPKMLVTLGVQIMNEKRHPSIRIFRILFHIHYLYLTFLEENPHLYEEISKNIKDFNSHENNRNKDAVPNLGAYFTNFLVNWDSAEAGIDTIFQEQLDRQVLWLLKQIPELEYESSESYLDDKRALICFKSQQSSYQLFLFWVMVAKFFKANFKSTKDLLEYYRVNLGRLDNKNENKIQENCFEILKINNYDEMFQYLGKGKLSQNELNDKLKQAIKNSKRKKYHGTDDEVLALPSKEEQLQNLNKDLPKLIDFVDAENKTLKSLTEEEWRRACVLRWEWIQELCENYSNTEAYNLAQLSDQYFSNRNKKKTERFAILKESYLQNNNLEELKPEEERYLRTFTWRDLFIKLDIEEHLVQIDNNPDFKSFYAKLQAAYEHIHSIVIPIVNVKNIKSGHYYLTALISNLPNLKHLEIVGSTSSTQLNQAALKALAKGFTNFVSKGGNLNELVYSNFEILQIGGNDIGDQLYSPLRSLVDIKAITFKNNNMLLFKGAKALSDVITTHKNLKELNLVNVNLDDKQAKEIADGLMRAKQIEVLNISKNPQVTHVGLNSIIYNLAFSPRLLCLDISYNPISSSPKNFIESLYKLLRISASLEILNLACCGSLNNYLSEEFFISLGEARTIRKLILANSGQLADSACNWLGKAIAFNAKKKGSLEVINLAGGVIYKSGQLSQLYGGMQISDADNETWYGDQSKVSKMSGNDFVKKYYNNLKILQLSNCKLASNFDIAGWKKLYKPEDPSTVKLISRSAHLVNLQLNDCSLNKSDADLLLLALDSTRPNFQSQLTILNLSRNSFGKEGTKTLASVLNLNKTLRVLDLSHNGLGVAGAKSIASALATNTTIRYLNLYANKIDVDGARAFEETLKSNSTLEYLDLGYNRLRNEGLTALSRGIASNPNLRLKYLGLRFNFIDSEGIITFLKKVYSEGAKSSLEEIFIKNNPINEFGLNDILKIYQKLNIKLSIDFFDKFKLVNNNVLERTIWVHPAPGTEEDVRHFFENTHKCGVVLSVRKRTGFKWPNRKLEPNTFYFVEFADPTSVTRALHIASRKEAFLVNKNVRIYKAGSGTYNFSRSKTKQVGRSRTNLSRPIRLNGALRRGLSSGRGLASAGRRPSRFTKMR